MHRGGENRFGNTDAQGREPALSPVGRKEESAPAPLGRVGIPAHDADIAVVEFEFVIVPRDPDGAHLLHGGSEVEPPFYAEQSLGLGVERIDAAHTMAVGTENPEAVERHHASRGRSFRVKAFVPRTNLPGKGVPPAAPGQRFDQANLRPALVGEKRQGALGIARVDPPGEFFDAALGRKAVVAREMNHRGRGVDGLAPGPSPDIAEHRPRLHRGQLVAIAQQDQPGIPGQRLHQPGHQGEVDHGGLVDEQDIEFEGVVGAVTKTIGRPSAAPEAAVNRGGRGGHAGLHGVGTIQGLKTPLHRALEMGGRLARGRHHLNPGRRFAPGQGLLDQERDDIDHRKGLARARPPGDHEEARAEGSLGGLALKIRSRLGLFAKEAIQSLGENVFVEAHGAFPVRDPRPQRPGEALLIVPITT